MKKYIVELSIEERKILTKLITSGRGPARMFTRARILLKADQSSEGPMWPDEKISEAFDVTVQTVYEDVTSQVGNTTINHYYLIRAVDDHGTKSTDSNRAGEYDRRLSRVK